MFSQLRWLLLLVATFLFVAAAPTEPAGASGDDVADEILFYRDDGLFRYYDIRFDASLPVSLAGGDGYTTGWSSIVAVDLDGGGQDEMFFYRDDGLYRYYNIKPDGSLGAVIAGGNGYTTGWSSIVAVDLDGDGQDEMFFYRDDGLYRYYNIRSDGSLGPIIAGGDGYTRNWSIIAALDLDGDGQDEMFFYRDDGLYRYYNVRANGSLGPLISGGDGYTSDWSSIVPIDLDGDARDELLFYRDDGLYRYYDVRTDGTLSSVIAGADGYTSGWSVIASVNLQGDHPIERVSRFTTFFDCCQNRVTNIRLFADEVDGAVILPGQTLSIDELTGPRTSGEGYLPAPYLLDGEGACCAVGGGISQFGTTLHNAVFWGGYETVEHRPHSIWISRYPLGIEATLFYSSIDYKFTNDTVTPLTIRTSSTATSVTVELWGNQGGWQVTGFHPRGARSSRITVLDQGGSEAKRVSARVTGSAPGLVTIVRTLTRDEIARSQTWFWRYVD